MTWKEYVLARIASDAFWPCVMVVLCVGLYLLACAADWFETWWARRKQK